MLSGKDSRSLWVEGAYGTGKSHAALTVKSMLEASDDEIRAYFKDYGLRMTLPAAHYGQEQRQIDYHPPDWLCVYPFLTKT